MNFKNSFKSCKNEKKYMNGMDDRPETSEKRLITVTEVSQKGLCKAMGIHLPFIECLLCTRLYARYFI